MGRVELSALKFATNPDDGCVHLYADATDGQPARDLACMARGQNHIRIPDLDAPESEPEYLEVYWRPRRDLDRPFFLTFVGLLATDTMVVIRGGRVAGTVEIAPYVIHDPLSGHFVFTPLDGGPRTVQCACCLVAPAPKLSEVWTVAIDETYCDDCRANCVKRYNKCVMCGAHGNFPKQSLESNSRAQENYAIVMNSCFAPPSAELCASCTSHITAAA